MSASTDPNRDDLLEAFLDGQLSEAQRAAFAESLRTDPARRRQVELQSRIDGTLGKLFRAEPPSQEQLAAALAGAAASRPALPFGEAAPAATAATIRSGERIYWAAAGIAAAAAIAWVLATLMGQPPGADEPYFAARPLAEIYQEAVASGFEPTYDCREPERFAAAFAMRQGQPLRLAAMPAGMRMLGLGYVGGLSRQTTAMLCRVDGQPVMVFIDREGADAALAAKVEGGALRVFREQRDGLVFYEVTPLAAPRVTQLLAPATSTGEPLPAGSAAPAKTAV